MQESAEYFFENIIFVSKSEAIAEFNNHGFGAEELFADLGEHDEYQASDVLVSLGY